MTNPKIMDLVVEAYSTIVFQLSLRSADEDSDGVSHSDPFEKDGLLVLEDEVKFDTQKLDKFVPIRFTADEKRLFAYIHVTIPVDLSNADEYDILRVVNRMNMDFQPCSATYNAGTGKIELGSYLSLVGSPVFFAEDAGASYQYEAEALTNLFAATLGMAADWIDRLAMLEKPNATAADVFNAGK